MQFSPSRSWTARSSVPATGDPVAGVPGWPSSASRGVNSQREMAAAFHRAGFDSYDVHMTDLFSGRVGLDEFRGMAVPGGFCYGDVLGAGEGWAKSILYNDSVRETFETFFRRDDVFVFGVCNGLSDAVGAAVPAAGCRSLAAVRSQPLGSVRSPVVAGADRVESVAVVGGHGGFANSDRHVPRRRPGAVRVGRSAGRVRARFRLRTLRGTTAANRRGSIRRIPTARPGASRDSPTGTAA